MVTRCTWCRGVKDGRHDNGDCMLRPVNTPRNGASGIANGDQPPAIASSHVIRSPRTRYAIIDGTTLNIVGLVPVGFTDLALAVVTEASAVELGDYRD